ncbi:MAG: DUF3488 and transglutaminase-like domain-containing protein [Casimicrobiaceae bacterium]
MTTVAATKVAHLLTRKQARWLGALILAVLLPQVAHVAAWAAIAGVALAAARFVLEARSAVERQRTLARVPSYVLAIFAIAAAVAVKQTYGIFIGRDPCVAFLFVLVGIKYFEARTVRDGTLLVCLASFLLVTPFFYDQSLLAAAGTLPGLVLLVCALQMLAPPGRIKAENRIRDPLRRSVRLLFEGIPLAILLFVLFPRLSAPLWGLPSDVGARTGLSDSMRPGSISELSLSDEVAFRVDFPGAIPPPHQRYWRGPVFTRFNGSEWSASAGRPEDRSRFARNGPQVLYTVTLEPHFKRSLFALDFPASQPRSSDPSLDEGGSVIGAVTRDQQLLARTPVTQTVRYTQVSTLVDRYPVDAGVVSDVEASANLELPRGSPQTREFARELRQTHADDESYIAAVLAWYREEPFFYTLRPPLTSDNPVDRFLFETRRGFCEHYAGSFVVLLRAAGIPARVVTGYQGGEINPNGRYLIVRQSDAHAWAEALIHGEWRRFDPTAAVAPNRIELGLGGALPSEQQVPFLARMDRGWFKRLRLSWDALNYDWRRNVVGFNSTQQQSLWRYWGLDNWAPWQIVLGVSILAALWGGGLLLWFALRHRQRDDRVVLLWNRLCRHLARAGLPRVPHEGPLDYANRAAARWPAFAAAFTVIGTTYAELRYGRATLQDAAAYKRGVARLKHAMAVLPGRRTLRTSAIG